MFKFAGVTGAVFISLVHQSIDASAKDFEVKVGQRVRLTEIRSPCRGGAAPDLALLQKWMAKPLEYGAIELGATYQKQSKVCPGKTLMMREMYYRAKAKGIDAVSIKWPDAGLVTWKVVVN